MVRAPARREPIPRPALASGLSALVCLRLRHDLSQALAEDGHAQGCAIQQADRVKWPRIRARSTTTVSPWMGLIAREVEFSRGAPTHIFHAVEQADYVSI